MTELTAGYENENTSERPKATSMAVEGHKDMERRFACIKGLGALELYMYMRPFSFFPDIVRSQRLRFAAFPPSNSVLLRLPLSRGTKERRERQMMLIVVNDIARFLS